MRITPLLKQAVVPLRSRSFIFLWLGQTISEWGDRCYEIALIWLITSLTGSTLLIGSLLAVNYIPTVLLLVFGGIWADRKSPRKIILWSDILRGCVTLVLAVSATLGYISIPILVFFSVFYGLLTAFFGPSLLALYGSLVSPEEYNAANSLRQLGIETASLLGPALGGYLIARFNVQAALLFDAITFFLSALSMICIRSSPTRLKNAKVSSSLHQRSFFSEATAGFRFLWQEQGMLAIALLFSFTNALNNTEAVLVPVLVRFELKLTAVQLGLMATCTGIGTLLGTLGMSLLGNRIRFPATTICISMIVFGCSIFFMGSSRNAWQLYTAYFIMGLTFIVAEIISSTLWFRMIPDDQRGRVFSAIGSITMVLNPLGFLLAGFLGKFFGLSTGLWLGGGTIAVLSFLAFFLPPVQGLNQYGQQTPHPIQDTP